MQDVPKAEQAVLEKLITLRQRLQLLNKDRTKYIKSQDVLVIYENLIDQVQRLNTIRKQEGNTADDQNRLDIILDDVFQLLSLCFMAAGKNFSSPSVYVQAATVKRLLDHVADSAVFTNADIDPIRARLADMRAIVQKDELAGETPSSIMHLIKHKLDLCDAGLERLTERLSVLSPELSSIQVKLVSIKRQMAALASRKTFNPSELGPLIDELRAIDAQRVNGQFLSPTGDAPQGQEIIIGLLEETFDFSQDLKAKGSNISPDLRPILERLLDLKSHLERLALTHRWTFRETDLYHYQSQLIEIDNKRGPSGKFEDSQGNVGEGQMVLLYLLRRCYAYLYQLLNSSVPVSEALMPIHNQLSTVRRCLMEVKKAGGPYSARELYPYGMKLNSIDGMRVAGKFMTEDGAIPEGQGTVHALLAECYELLHELRSEIEEDSN